MAASLTFGACGGGGGDDSPPTSSRLAELAEDWIRSFCNFYGECYYSTPATRRAYVEYCIREYTSYYDTAYFAAVVAAAPDQDGCRLALADALECYSREYAGLSCDELGYSYLCEEEEAVVEAACDFDL